MYQLSEALLDRGHWPRGVLTTLNHMVVKCSMEIKLEVRDTFVKNDKAQVEDLVKFLEYLWKTKGGDGRWEMGSSNNSWDAEVLIALQKYDK